MASPRDVIDIHTGALDYLSASKTAYEEKAGLLERLATRFSK